MTALTWLLSIACWIVGALLIGWLVSLPQAYGVALGLGLTTVVIAGVIRR